MFGNTLTIIYDGIHGSCLMKQRSPSIVIVRHTAQLYAHKKTYDKTRTVAWGASENKISEANIQFEEQWTRAEQALDLVVVAVECQAENM